MPALQPVAQRTLVIALVLVAVLAVGALFVLGRRLWLLFFAASLLALLLRGIAGSLASRTKLGERAALVVVILVGLGLAILAGFLLAPRIAEQAREFAELIPSAVQDAGKRLGVDVDPVRVWVRRKLGGGNLGGEQLRSAGRLVEVTASAIIGLVVILVVGLYFAASPEVYLRGSVRLFPLRHRSRAREVLGLVGKNLQLFLLGRVASMVFVTPLTGLALTLLGVPVPWVLALLTGAFTFVPYAGPITAAIPIFLVAATAGLSTLSWAALAYTAIQAGEGFVITPLVQQRMVHMPPALTIGAEVLAGTLFGPIGVIVSVPLAVAAMVLVERLYVQGLLERAGGTSADARILAADASSSADDP